MSLVNEYFRMESSRSPTKQYNESCPFLALTKQVPIGPKRIAKMSHVMECSMSYVPCCDSPLIISINMSYHVISPDIQRFSMAENISLRTTESSFSVFQQRSMKRHVHCLQVIYRHLSRYPLRFMPVAVGRSSLWIGKRGRCLSPIHNIGDSATSGRRATV